MEPASTPHQPAFQHELLSIRQDPKVIALALHWAGHRELAEDALQMTYYRVASVRHPERIFSLRAYFIRVLKNEITSLYALPQRLPLDDHETLSQASAPAVDDQACRSLQYKIWLKRHASQHDHLIAAIPARSNDSARYHELIHAAGRQVLLGHLSLEPNDPAFPNVMRVTYPDYFNEPGAAPNTLHQRISRARDDIKALLRAIINREELF
jgi:DNA-directed RNA polymerase specialized sigma24 family protein